MILSMFICSCSLNIRRYFKKNSNTSLSLVETLCVTLEAEQLLHDYSYPTAIDTVRGLPLLLASCVRRLHVLLLVKHLCFLPSCGAEIHPHTLRHSGLAQMGMGMVGGNSLDWNRRIASHTTLQSLILDNHLLAPFLQPSNCRTIAARVVAIT